MTISSPVLLSGVAAEETYSWGIHRLPNGNFVVAYDDSSDGRGIYAQIFAPNGTTIGDPILVAVPAADYDDGSDQRSYPSVTDTASGGFAVSWADRGRNLDYDEPFTRLFNADGTPVSDVTLLGPLDGTTSDAILEIDATPWGGGINAIWDETDIPGSIGDTDVYNQTVNGDGTVASDIFDISGSNPFFQGESQIETLFNPFTGTQNGLVMVFVDESTGQARLQALVYDAAGAFLTTGYLVAEEYRLRDVDLAALTDGSYVTTWTGFEDGKLIPTAMIARPEGFIGPFELFSSSDGIYAPSIDVTETSGGGFAVSYGEAVYYTGSTTDFYYNIVLQLYDGYGRAIGGPTLIDTGEDVYPWKTDISTLMDGTIAVTWSTTDNRIDFDSYVAVFDFEGPALFGDCLDDITGTAGADMLVGDFCDNTLTGDEGDDTLRAGSGDDTLSGDDGDDELTGDDGDDHLDGGGANDMLMGGAGDDVIDGGRGHDTVDAGEGDDDVRAGVGDDHVDGGEGQDFIRGGIGEDTLIGGEDDDRIVGQKNADDIDGGAGDDNLKGGGGNDTIIGGAGDDFIKGGTRQDVLNGGAGDDRIFANSFADVLNGNEGNDLLNAGGDSDTLNGGFGNDTLKGGGGTDTFIFEAGMEADVVLDFQDDSDLLQISAALTGGVTDAAAVVSTYANVVGGNTVLDFGGGARITLNGVADETILIDDITIV